MNETQYQRCCANVVKNTKQFLDCRLAITGKWANIIALIGEHFVENLQSISSACALLCSWNSFTKATRYDAHGRNRVLTGLRNAIHAAFAHAAAKPCLRFASCEFELADETPDIAGRMPFTMA